MDRDRLRLCVRATGPPRRISGHRDCDEFHMPPRCVVECVWLRRCKDTGACVARQGLFSDAKDGFVTLVIGHKGAAGLAPENTLAAIRVARDVGADGVELDVRRTADGALAVHHDAELPDGRVVATTGWSELPDDVPDLDAVLDISQGLAMVNVEIKNWPADVDYDDTLSVADAVVSPALVERAHDEELAVNAWTCNDPERIRWLAETGVDGIVTDRPDITLAALGRTARPPGGP